MFGKPAKYFYDNYLSLKELDKDKEAFKSLHKAATLGHVPAFRKLGCWYSNGLGVDKNKKEAIVWYEKDIKKGGNCYNALGVCYHHIDKNDKLVYFLNKGMECNDKTEQADCNFNMSLAYKIGLGGCDKSDVSTRIYHLLKSKELGRTDGIQGELDIIKEEYGSKFLDDAIANFAPQEREVKYKCSKEVDRLLAELDAMIGLDQVKERVKSLVSEISIRNERVRRGMKTGTKSYHLVFTGNAGTGKTVIARLLSKIFCALGVAKNSTFIESCRSDLVAEYVGHTAIKTDSVIDRALGGVLFIDEAYALNGTGNDYGKEAITTLLRRMENDRDNLIVIMAGYDKEMKALLDTNQGLDSRFSRTIHFDDYDVPALIKIYNKFCGDNDYTCETDVEPMISDIINNHLSNNRVFANGRTVRNFFEKVIEVQEIRLFDNFVDIRKIEDQQICELSSDDVNKALLKM